MIPAAFVKNKQERMVVLNDIVKQTVESRRGTHKTFVFTYKGGKVNRIHNSGFAELEKRPAYQPSEFMI